MAAFQQMAAHMLRGGYSPMPIRAGTKLPLLKNWDRLRGQALSVAEIAEINWRAPDAGLAVVGGYNCLVPIDIDTDDPDIVAAIRGALPEPLVVKAGRRGHTAYYWDESGMIDARKFQQPLGDGKFAMLLEIVTTGATTIPPTIHAETRRPYRWLTPRTLFNTRVHELSVIRPVDIEGLAVALRRWVPERKAWVAPSVPAGNGHVTDARRLAYARVILDSEARRLSSMDAGSGRNIGLFHAVCKLGRYVHHGILHVDEMRQVLMQACQANGLLGDDGVHGCNATIASGLRKSAGDDLPALTDRPRQKAERAMA